MNRADTLKLAQKEVKAEETAEKVAENPRLISEVFDGTSSEDPRVKFKSAKTLKIISERNPKILYPKIDIFISLLDSENKIIKWIATDVIGNLTSVDLENKFDKVFQKYYDLLSAPSMITVGHIIENSGKIAKSKPYLTQKITSKLLDVEQLPVKPPITQECKNILLGKVIQAFEVYFSQIENAEDVTSFAKRQLNNPRRATKAKAESFLKRLDQMRS
jgi:hypothetical protein